jgi:spore coat polysaccharide biosynthesis predicted glycosyltransferase SpsG
MFAICVESSHKKGMGHFFKMLNFVEYLKSKNEEFIILINEDKISNEILKDKRLPFNVVDLNNVSTNWETDIIKNFKIDVWLNDRLETSSAHAINVRGNDVYLVTIDDLGEGAELSNIHFAAMPCVFNNNPKGEKICSGIKYIILDKEIEKYKKLRNKQDKILVTLGGSDTYGTTIKVVKILNELAVSADIIIGPSFKHKNELLDIAADKFNIKHCVPSLIEEFKNYDMAIAGGGITPFEANASGLPCIIIANEPHEVENAVYLNQLGSSVFAGFHDSIDKSLFSLDLEISKMSKNGLDLLTTSAVEEIYNEIP